MAPRRVKKPRRSASYYRSHPEARAKKNAAQRKRNKTSSVKAHQAELKKARRKDGNVGKGGKDYSHTKSGRLVRENSSSNRARQGAGGRARRK